MSPIGSTNKRSEEIDVVGLDETPTLSRTHRYRKIMKPLIERKRRARINSYMDELKDLLVAAVQAEGESITKLEKADVLELTIKHLQKLKRQQMLQTNSALDMDRYGAGYTACASEVGRFMSTVPGVNINLGTRLMSHLGERVNSIEQTVPSGNTHKSQLTITVLPHQYQQCQKISSSMLSKLSRPQSYIEEEASLLQHNQHFPAFSPLSDGGYNSGRDSSPSPSRHAVSPKSATHPSSQVPNQQESVWRPFL